MLRKIRSCLRFAKHTKENLSDLNNNQDGNIFFMLFGAVAVVGLLGTAVMSTMRGPLSTMVEIQSRTQAESEMGVASHLALLEATELANAGDCDGDGFVEPLEFADAGGLGPVGGGFLPNAVASSRIDPWGTEYGYCAWDAGAATDTIGCDIDASGTNNRLDGNGNPTDETYTVIAIVSAGPDQVFGTTCTGGANPSISKTGDDMVVEFTYASANAASNGLWNLKSGDPTTAQIDKNLEITGAASFSAGIDLTSSSAALSLGAASMLFPNETTLATCNGANDGLIRINTVANPDFLELCDDPTGWVAIGGNLWSTGAGDDIYYDSGTTPQIGIGKTDPSEALDVSGNIDVSGNLDAGGDLIAGGNADVTGTLDVAGTTTLGILNATGAVDFSSTLNVTGNITGSSGMYVSNTGTSFAVNVAGHYTGDYRFQVPSGTTRNLTFRHTAGGWDAAKIEVSKLSGSNADGTMHLYTTGHGNSQLFLDELGNVGIGTTSPNAQLHVSGSTILTSTLDAQGTISNSTGNVSVGDNLDVSNDLDVTGDIVGENITANDNLYVGTTINVDGDQLGPALNCTSSQKLEWTDGSGWSCVTDLQGGGGGGIPSLDDLTDVAVTTPANGECLIYDNVSGDWENAPCIGTGAGIFEIVSNVIRVKSGAGNYTNDDFVVGSPQLDDDGDANHDARMFFDKSKGAFRAGGVTSTEWDDANIGTYSFAIGLHNTASGSESFAGGWDSTAAGFAAFAWGNGATANGHTNVAMGQDVTASAGDRAFAFGQSVTTTGSRSFGFGLGNTAGVNPRISAGESFGIFMGDQSGVDLSVSNRMGLYGGDLLIDDDGTAGSQGCIQYNGTTSELEFSDDCTTFTAFSNGSLGLWTDLTGGRIHYGTTSANQVGIGTSNPQTTLDVNGGVRVGSVSGGAAPTFMAINDLSDVAAAVPSDSDCLVYNNASGDWENVACSSLGVGAINDLSDAYTDYVTDFNMYMGDGAGVSSSPGQYNLALGQDALASLDGTCTNAWECDYNIAVGHSALTANTLGARNVAIGAEALQANTTGQINVAVGYAALASNTVGSANYYSGNVAVGAWALTNADQTELNVAIGTRALEDVTNASGGSYNTGVGGAALGSVTTGLVNTGLGHSAGSNITTGSRNIMIGAQNAASATGNDQLNIGNVITGDMATGDIAIIGTAALAHPSGTTAQRPATGVNGMIRYNSTLNEFEGYENGSWVSMGGSAGAGAINDLTDGYTDYVTDHNMFLGNTAGNSILAGGNNNVFIGEIAGEDTTSGSYNVFIGREAGRNNITGEWNTFVGDDSGRANTGGSYNTAFGGYSLRANIGGSQNTAIGDGTLEVNTTGGNNTALGRQALFTSGTGNNNVALGRNALHISNGASNNTTIGTNAGDNITTGSDNILIGYNVDAASATSNDQINIGNVITGDMATGDIAIIGTAALAHPSGTTAQRPSTGVNGMIRYNSTLNEFEGYENGAWTSIGGSAGAGAINDLSDGYTDYTTDHNLFMGDGAGAAIASGGQYNTFIGETAGAANTTADRGIAIGYEALATNTTGYENSAVGYHALYLNTTGGSNTAFGTGPLRSNTTGSQNTASGFKAMFENTIGSDNTATGYQALENNVAKSRNTAFGYEAMRYADDTTTASVASNTAVGYRALTGASTPSANTGIKNVALGSSALTDNTTGTDNVATGYHALFVNTTGDNNVATGSLSLGSNISGGNNTATGYFALANNTTGDNNAALGYWSLRDNTDGEQNVAVGSAALRFNTTGDNSTATGYLALGDNTTGGLNAAFGWNTLESNVAKSGNTAIGSSALRYADSTASASYSYNTAIGFGSLTGSSTPANNIGIYNTALGAKTLTANTSGGNNVAIGYQTGDLNTTGSDNILIGYDVDAPLATTSDHINIGNVITGDLGTGDIAIIGTAALTHPSGTTAERPSTGVNGMIRYNSTLNEFEGYENGSWVSMGSGSAALTFPIDVEGETVIMEIGTGNVPVLVNAAANNNLFLGEGAGASVTPDTPSSGDGERNTFIGISAGATNTSGQRNTFVGYQAGQDSTTGNGNTAVGRDAGANNTTGGDNTYVGSAAGTANTTNTQRTIIGAGAGYNNAAGSSTFYGAYAGFDNTGTSSVMVGSRAGDESDAADRVTIVGNNAGRYATADNNTLIGYQSGQAANGADLTGTNNTFLGYQTGLVTTSGADNVFIGDVAGRTNTTGYSNTFVGADAGYANTDGYYNAFFGAQTGAVNSSGFYNAFFGDYAGNDNTTGDSNTFIGSAAGFNNIGGLDNTFLGRSAGRISTSGGSNVFIGHETADNSTTGSRNIIIGANADNLTATTNDYLNIGDVIIGDLTTGNIQIVGTAALTNPSGTTAQRPSTGVNGMIRYNSTLSKFEAYENSSWINMIGGAGGLWTDNTTHITRQNFHILDTGLAAGSTTAGLDGNGTYAFYDPDKGAFRGGTISGGVPYWQDVNIGTNSFAFGTNTRASGTNSVAFGGSASASGSYSAAFGNTSSASGDTSFATGFTSSASGSTSFATGYATTASSGSSTAMGAYTTASGTASMAMGRKSTADGESSIAMGLTTTVNNPATAPIVSGDESFGIFMGDQSGYDLTTANRMALVGGDFLIDDDGTAGAEGCIRFVEGTGLQFSHDCSTYVTMGAGGSGAINDLSDAAKNLTTNNLFLAHNGGSVGATDNFNTVIGIEALDALNNSAADNNIAIGYQALTANTNGDDNIAIGYQALSITTNGSDNIAIGSETLLVNSTGDRNVAIGNSALIANTLGDDNIVLGDGAMEENTSGNDNIALGNTALGDNINGDDNIAIGTQALAKNTDGDDNIAIGDGALTDAGSSDYSIAIGVDALGNFDGAANTYNTAIGYRSLRGTNGAAIGIENTALGANTGIVFTTGENNVLIGYNAGDSITTGSDNIIIGHDVDTPAATTSNHLNIGDLITGTLGSGLLTINGTGALTVPAGTTAQRPTAVNGMMRYNSTNSLFEIYQAGSWTNLAGTSSINDLSDGLTDYTTDHNIFMGDNAGAAIATGGQYNTAIGENSGEAITTGDQNTAIGYSALNDNTTGTSNTAVGFLSLSKATGGDNTSIGSNALAKSTSGSDNTVVGSAAMYENLTGGNNTAIGRSVLRQNTTGSDNVAIGYYALNQNVANSRNTAVGILALSNANDTATGIDSLNTAMGYEALKGSATPSSNTGIQNSAFGAYSFHEMTSGNYNTGLGYDTGHAISSGDGNITIGYKAAASLTTGENNIIIGTNTDAVSATADFQLNIGDTIYGDLDNDYVGIGNSSPDVALDVTGDIEYSGTLTDISDRRLKDNIKPLGQTLDRIAQIDTYSFTMKEDKKGRTEFGVMAQELEEIFPTLVHTAKDEMGTKSVNYVGLIAPMIEATKELRAENTALKSGLDDLSQQVALLNNMAGNNVGKASMMPYFMLLFGLLGGMGFMLLIQRKQQK